MRLVGLRLCLGTESRTEPTRRLFVTAFAVKLVRVTPVHRHLAVSASKLNLRHRENSFHRSETADRPPGNSSTMTSFSRPIRDQKEPDFEFDTSVRMKLERSFDYSVDNGRENDAKKRIKRTGPPSFPR